LQLNQIENISALKSDNFKELEELNLYHLTIIITDSDIEEILKFKNLKKLDIAVYKVKKSNLKETLVSKFNLINKFKI